MNLHRAFLITPSILLAMIIMTTGCGNASLFSAIDNDDAELITKIGERSKRSLNTANTQGESPLVYAIRNGKKNAYKALLQAGADPNELNYHKWGGILEAAGNKDSFYLRQALEYGGDANLDNRGSSQRRTTVLMQACKDECLENLEILINAGANINYICEYRDALGRASESNQFTIVLALLEQGADYRRKSDRYTSFAGIIFQKTPDKFLDKARRENFRRVIDWLAEKGVDWQKPIRDGDAWVY